MCLGFRGLGLGLFKGFMVQILRLLPFKGCACVQVQGSGPLLEF